MTDRAELLDEAKSLITGDRNVSYGPPTSDFQRTADLLNAMGYQHGNHEQGHRALVAHDVALIMAQLKLSRLVWSPGKRDSWVDLAGYAACGWECANEELNRDYDQFKLLPNPNPVDLPTPTSYSARGSTRDHDLPTADSVFPPISRGGEPTSYSARSEPSAYDLYDETSTYSFKKNDE